MATMKQVRQELKKGGRKAAIWIEVEGPQGQKVGTYVECIKSYVVQALSIFDDSCKVEIEVYDQVVYIKPIFSTAKQTMGINK